MVTHVVRGSTAWDCVVESVRLRGEERGLFAGVFCSVGWTWDLLARGRGNGDGVCRCACTEYWWSELGRYSGQDDSLTASLLRRSVDLFVTSTHGYHSPTP